MDIPLDRHWDLVFFSYLHSYYVDEIRTKMTFNKNSFGALDDFFGFVDNNLGGSPKYLRELCEALIPLKKNWGCALTFNILKDESLVKLMARAGCRYIYTGLESLNPDSIQAMNKGQNKLTEIDAVIRRAFSNGIVLSFGLIVGSDGDTNEYLEKVPSTCRICATSPSRSWASSVPTRRRPSTAS